MVTILCAWDPDLSVLIGCAALLVAYWAVHRSNLSRAGWFVGGTGVMLFALISPIDTLGDEYLFSVHMIQHLLLVLVVPPLLLAGITPAFASRVIECRPLGEIERRLRKPVIAWLIGIVTLTLWHAPVLFDAALNNEYIHILEHLSFLASATIFWWPVFGPLPQSRLAPLLTLLYLVGAAIANSLLGIWLTFAPAGLYTPYLHPEDSLGILKLLRLGWGLTPAVDQELGGLFMWVGGSFVFLAVMVAVLLRWFGFSEMNASSSAASF